MLDTQVYAAVMLAMGMGAMGLMVSVLSKQASLFKLKAQSKEIKHFRQVLFALALTIFATDLVPATVDLLTLFVDLGRPNPVPSVTVFYVSTVHISNLAAAYLIWRLYNTATEREKK